MNRADFPQSTRYVQTRIGSIAVLPDGRAYRVQETGRYPSTVERLYTLDEARHVLVAEDFAIPELVPESPQ